MKLLVIRDMIRSEYSAESCASERLVEISVLLWFRIRSLSSRNSWEATKLLTISVPRSSMISRSQENRRERSSVFSSAVSGEKESVRPNTALPSARKSASEE